MPIAPDAETAENIYCPECGYDLRAIPENRCPECGLGYEHAAIRTIAAVRGGTRLWLYQRIVVLAVVAFSCQVLAEASALSSFLIGHLVLAAFALGLAVVQALLLACMLFWASLGNGYFRSFWHLLGMAVMLPTFTLISLAAPVIPLALATLLVGYGLVRLLSSPQRFTESERSLRDAERRKLRIWRWAAWSCLLLAAVLTVFAWTV